MGEKIKKTSSPDNRRELAQMLYMQNYPQKKIASMVDASEVSVSRWVRQGEWEELRKRTLNSKTSQLAMLYDELAEFNRMISERDGYKVATSKEADARRKLIRDIADLEQKYNIAQTTTIARDFVTFVRNSDPDLSSEVLSYFNEFIDQMVKEARWHE